MFSRTSSKAAVLAAHMPSAANQEAVKRPANTVSPSHPPKGVATPPTKGRGTTLSAAPLPTNSEARENAGPELTSRFKRFYLEGGIIVLQTIDLFGIRGVGWNW